ncbi:MAG: hypothetical protein AAF772_16860, partial [Acidobacteriota bacterium]
CCHLLHKKDDPEHRAALEAALREGLDDPEREDWLVYDLWADLGLGDGLDGKGLPESPPDLGP